MRKLLLLLNLIALGAISQVTPVGGYLPINSSKSYTAGNATCSNVIARGTLSVGSTATVTSTLNIGGASNTSSAGILNIKQRNANFFIGERLGVDGWSAIYGSTVAPSTTNHGFTQSSAGASFINGATGQSAGMSIAGTAKLYLDATTGYINSPMRIGSNVTPTATLDVTGDMKVSSTFSLGSANLVGGNTGTVAVLSDALFSLEFENVGSGTNPSDGTTYYIYNNTWGTNATLGRVLLPYNCTLVGFSLANINNTADGSAETCTLSVRANNSTDTQLSSTIHFSTSTIQSATGLSASLSANDLINVKIVTPTWVTNPQGVYCKLVLWFVRRS